MIRLKNVANAVGGKTARACDACVKRRARWYCASDDAFLCQVCDSSVHSANPLARRHERLRLKSASSALRPAVTWHRGFTRKARTPRHGKKASTHHHSWPVVPELCSDDQMSQDNNKSTSSDINTGNDDDQKLHYRVPVLETLVAEKSSQNDGVFCNESCLSGLFPSDKELAEFAADMETLLGKGLENESFAMEDLGLGDRDVQYKEPSLVKMEEQEGVALRESEGEIHRGHMGDHHEGAFQLSFDYDLSTGDGDENKVIIKHEEEVAAEEVNNISADAAGDEREEEKTKQKKKKKVLLLRLDYEGVLSAWGGQEPPWTTGDRPEFDPDDDCWPGYTGRMEEELRSLHGGDCGGAGGGVGGLHHPRWGDGGRQARVSRYREKRRTRLFSKKIRYEVRKLNAEKRPRMKGRFVKRTSLSAPAYPFP